MRLYSGRRIPPLWQKVCDNCGWKNDGRETRCHICGAKLGDGHAKNDDAYWKDRLRGKPEGEVRGYE